MQQMKILPGKENNRPNCFAFYINKSGAPGCHALCDVYCLKEHTPCAFRKTPEAAAKSRQNALRRLASIGRTNG